MPDKSGSSNNGKTPASAAKAEKPSSSKEKKKPAEVHDESAQPTKRLKVKEPTEASSFSAFKGAGPSDEGTEYGPKITMNLRSASKDPSVKWLIEVWLVNMASIRELLSSDTGFHPCNGATYVPTLRMWRCTARTWQQAFYIGDRVVAELAKKGKTCKWEKKKLQITVPVANKLEAFMTAAGKAYWVLQGTDTYFCADVCKKYNSRFVPDEKVWDNIDYNGKDEIVERCQKFGIPIEVIEEEDDQADDQMTEVADP
mmetsp:Transcript_32235/g.50261  ORF Transcript_32235/g.50261 Transcript_32235/m.50261 type:complete len:256 (+) Transcript_32235:104-871(+)|eukprot:CAMPEP_0184327190 /NCGR_PEP_ID=MMETSP1049-20130417/142963_1 /TAXON_ID=77928 /ORGANISM="Proteomonas sulcata, Strain CCMP704" /LENGTH=255 /DNA_ID=CAMNT_0026649435 /DNA_START=26 /DNA_END=793 /DNA_ORIENTATION=-